MPVSDERISLINTALWRELECSAPMRVRVRGHLFGGGFATHGVNALDGADDPRLNDLSRETDGLFAAIVEDDHHIFAAVDRVGTIPLYYGWDGTRWRVSDNGGLLAKQLGLDVKDVNADGALALAMSGYTVGADTLYKSLNVLNAGQSVVLGPERSEVRTEYDLYSSWDVIEKSDDDLHSRLVDVTLGVLEKMIRSVQGRTIVVPLSAGLDSRLIVSGLRHLDHNNVKCFSYGLRDNHEARAAQHIAQALGYPWTFVPYTPDAMSRFFASDDHAGYLNYADSCMNVPFEQDLYAIRALQKQGYIRKDNVIVNGNSGDFITGNHIIGPFRQAQTDLTPDQRRDLIVQTMIEKHYRLWRALVTPENDSRMARRLEQDMHGPLTAPEGLHGVYEFLEFINRQSKFVVSGQRVYEYAGHDWRLPLWDCAYLDFWRTVPLRAKVGQNLYKSMLHKENWGGVWQGSEWHYPQTIVPAWLRGPRYILKALHAPLGRAAWHTFEKRFLGYWMESLQGQALHPYRKVAMDTRGARHMISWHTEAYLNSKGLDWRGKPL